MTEASERRRQIAQRVVDVLAARTELHASLLAGSAAQGNSDEHSDIDLLNYYEALPDIHVFEDALLEVGATPTGPIGVPGPQGFVSRYDIEGIELQTGGEPIAEIEKVLAAISAGNVDWATSKFAMGLLEGMPLFGAERIRDWQDRAAYPETLRRRIVEENLGFFPIWRADEQLARRDAELFRRQMLLDGAFRVVAVLSALNRLYFSTFQFKRAAGHCAQMKLKPERLAERLDLVANGAPSAAAEELRTLVEDTKAIVRSEMPDAASDLAWQPPQDGR